MLVLAELFESTGNRKAEMGRTEVVREGITEKVTFAQRPQGGKRSMLGRKRPQYSDCQCPGVC